MENNREIVREKIKLLAEGYPINDKSGEYSLNKHFDSDTEISKLNIETYKKTETQKLKLRERLSKAIKRMIWIQLIFFNIVVILVVSSVIFKKPFFNEFNKELAPEVFGFLKYYISATIAELLGMRWFILHYVFSPHKILKDKNIAE